MTAKSIVQRLLEADDDINPEEVSGATMRHDFERGLDYITARASDLYERLEQANVLAVLRKERPYDQTSISTAVLLLALDDHGSVGVDRAYRSLKRHARYII